MMPKESFAKGKEILARRSLADDCPWCPAKAGETCLRYDYDHPGHPKERGSEARAQLDSFPFECGARNEETDAFCQLKKGHAGSHYGQSRSLHKPLAWSAPPVAPGEYERPEPHGQIPEPTCELVDDGDYCTTHLQPSNLCRAAQPAAAQAEEIPQRAAEDAAWSIMGRERHLATAVKLVRAEAALTSCREERDRARALLNTPEVHDFAKAIPLEAAHQRARWGEHHDIAKTPEDWYWNVGYLAGKALHSGRSGDIAKALHHVVTCAAFMANWHAHLMGKYALKPVSDRQPEGETK